METPLIYEIIGYVASVLVAISLMMSKIVTLRVVNLVGAATFSFYGYLIGSIPVAAMNGFIVLINIYYLQQMFRSETFFKLLEVSTESDYLRYFLNFYEKDIKKTQSGFKQSPENNSICVFVLRDMVPAGLVIGHPNENGILTIDVDYVIPQYRDFKIGHYLFNDKKSFFVNKGITEIRAYAGTASHKQYLMHIGFSVDDRENWYYLSLT